MYRRRIVAPLALLVLPLLAGCAPSPVGKWKMATSANGMTVTGTMEFRQNGTLSQTLNAPMAGEVKASGTYKTNGDKMEIQVTDVELGQQAMAMVPPAMQDTIRKQIKEGIAKNGKQETTFKIENDKMTLTRDGQSMTMDRVKE
ncbi:MAG: hypothetical protein SFU56_22790 [Capsulimonadales bacterium]|nr:hypothetical protein [Capsulimonadales bacterium]